MLALFCVAWGAAAPSHAAEFLEAGQAFRLQVTPSGGGQLRLHWDIAPGYYLYRDRIAVTVPAGQPQARVERPAGQPKGDPNFGRVDVYHRAVDVGVDPGSAGSIEITWQGCAEQGVCYPPQHRRLSLPRRAGRS